MTYSEIKITFNSDLSDETITFKSGEYPTGVFSTITKQWVELRQGPNQVSVGTPTGTPGERSAINFVTAFELDQNDIKTYTLERLINVVTVKANSTFYDFGDPQISANPSNVTFLITNSSEEEYLIDSILFSASLVNVATHVRCSVETSEVADRISGTYYVDNSIGNNPIIFEVLRGSNFLMNSEKGADILSQSVRTPDTLDGDTIEVEIQGTPDGSKLIIETPDYGLTLEYSLNGTTWQDENVFDSLAPGNYTVFVRDQFAHQTSKTIDISENLINSPYNLVSKSNSIRFKNVIVWGDAANYKNDENTLSCEVDVPIPRRELLKFQTADVITTQFRSNYPTVSATIKDVQDPNTASTQINIVQMSQNMGRTDSRDSVRFNVNDGTNRTAIIFTAGNLYDYATGTITGTYALNGNRPEWGNAGNFVHLPGSGWHLIEAVLYIEERGAEALIITEAVPLTVGQDATTIVKSFYNLFNYEVYEFTIDFIDWINKYVQVQIVNEGTAQWDEITHLSEIIDVKVRHERTLEIRYSNDSNTDIFYATGIVHKIRIPFEKKEARFDDDSETYKTDTSAELLETTIHEMDYFEFRPISTELMRKVVQALSHSDVYLDGVKYVKDTIEEPQPLGQTNKYIIGAVMIKSENVYNSDSGAVEFSTGNIEIPALIPIGDGYVKYQ